MMKEFSQLSIKMVEIEEPKVACKRMSRDCMFLISKAENPYESIKGGDLNGICRLGRGC